MQNVLCFSWSGDSNSTSLKSIVAFYRTEDFSSSWWVNLMFIAYYGYYNREQKSLGNWCKATNYQRLHLKFKKKGCYPLKNTLLFYPPYPIQCWNSGEIAGTSFQKIVYASGVCVFLQLIRQCHVNRTFWVYCFLGIKTTDYSPSHVVDHQPDPFFWAVVPHATSLPSPTQVWLTLT